METMSAQWETKPVLYAATRDEWRRWLRANYKHTQEIWLIYYKKHTGKPCVAYDHSVEEALCFGWIDGLKRSVDDERYAYRFTPRRPGSKWSPLNITRAEHLIAAGKMTKAGLAAFDCRVEYEPEILKARDSKEIPLTAELERGLRANKTAWRNFNKLSPGYRKRYAGWLRSAKRPATRAKRLQEVIRLLVANEKPAMK